MKIAVLGFGVVGRGVVDMIEKAPNPELGYVLVRAGKADEPWKTDELDVILSDESVDAVAEVMGGIEPARSYAERAIKAGKHFVTSNKALVAAHGLELSALARENGTAFLFSAACGGGVPFLHNLAWAVKTDEVKSLGGILNGTTNYMLDAMQSKDWSYEEALKDAQALGYAEADPTADVTGLDALRKIMLACAVGFDVLPQKGLLNEGIDSLTADDVADFKKRGLVCRLLAKGEKTADGISAYVEPWLMDKSAPECAVRKNYNMARYEGECSGPMVLMGQGAGRYPTASAVLRDLTYIGSGEYYMLSEKACSGEADNSASFHNYYVRLPKEFSGAFKCVEAETDGEVVRGVTEKMSVSEMHAAARSIRDKGAKIFFAGLETEK